MSFRRGMKNFGKRHCKPAGKFVNGVSSISKAKTVKKFR